LWQRLVDSLKSSHLCWTCFSRKAFPSLKRLSTEFVGDSYTFEGQSRSIHFRRQVLNRNNTIIDDIVDEASANGALDTIGELIRGLKQEGRIIHFSISGGRRLITFLSFSAALLYFDTLDELLHLYTPEQIKAQTDFNNIMHLPPNIGQRPIEVPLARAVQPLFSSLLNRSRLTAPNGCSRQFSLLYSLYWQNR
jgi:CRISPR-associated protein Csx14